MQFKDIPGQNQLKAYFKRLVLDDRMPHALMLVGGEGHGKLALALALSVYLQCPNKTDVGACGNCNSCKKAEKYIHPDIHFSFPVVKKDKLKREDTTSNHFLPEWRSFLAEQPFGGINEWLMHLEASEKNANINVAECNQMIKHLGLQTYEGQYKIQLVWYADYLGKEGNRILKLVEEPTPNTIIILITNNRSHILNTLRSRCQIITVPPIEDQAMLQHIKDSFDLTEADTQELAFLSQGNIRKALQLGRHTELNYSENIMDLFRIAYSGDPEKLIPMVDELAGMGRNELSHFLEYGLHFMREYLLYLNTNKPSELRLTQAEKEVSQKMTKIIDMSKTSNIQALLERYNAYIKRNLSLKSMIMQMSLEINGILRAEVNNFTT